MARAAILRLPDEQARRIRATDENSDRVRVHIHKGNAVYVQ